MLRTRVAIQRTDGNRTVEEVVSDHAVLQPEYPKSHTVRISLVGGKWTAIPSPSSDIKVLHILKADDGNTAQLVLRFGLGPCNFVLGDELFVRGLDGVGQVYIRANGEDTDIIVYVAGN